MSSLRTGKGVQDRSNGQRVDRRPTGRPKNRRPVEPVFVSPGCEMILHSLPVESARCAHSIRSHLSPCQPVSYLQALRKMHDASNTVHRIAGRAPHARLLGVVAELHRQVNLEVDIGRRLEWSDAGGLVGDGQRVWMDDLMVEKDAVE